MTTETSSTDNVQAAPPAPVDLKPDIPAPLAALAAGIEDPDEACVVNELFVTLNSLLREVEVLDPDKAVTTPGSGGDAPSHEQAGAVFSAVKAAAHGLAEQIEAYALSVRAEGELAGALSGVGFAIRHELRVVFGDEPDGDAPAAALEPGKVAHAHGLLRNCFQQCILLIVKAIDPGVDEAELFDDGRVRLQQTLLLRDALASLITSVSEAERKHYPQSAVALIEEVEKFRRESLGYLMRKDWATFESLAAEVVSAREPAAFKVAARRFRTYVETLLAHVQMRSVLAQHTPAPHAAAAPPFMRAVMKPAVWTAAAACALVAAVIFVAPRLSAKALGGEQASTLQAAVEEVTTSNPAPVQTARAVVAREASPRAGARGRVVIQLGAYGSESVAAAQAERLRASGVEAFVTRAQTAGGVAVFRVQAGPFENRAEAALAGRRLQARGAVQSFVVAEQG